MGTRVKERKEYTMRLEVKLKRYWTNVHNTAENSQQGL